MAKRWSKKVNETSDAMDLESDIFKAKSAKSSPFRSAMSMITFYLNRAGKNLSASRKEVINRAKNELRRIYGKPLKSR